MMQISTWRDVAEEDACRKRVVVGRCATAGGYSDGGPRCKRLAIKRNCLTRSEHAELLSTPRGYTWTGKRGLSYIAKRCLKLRTLSNGVHRRATTMANHDSAAMWQHFVKQFLQSTEGSMNPATKKTLTKILLSKADFSDPKWSTYTNAQTELCHFLSNLNVECSSVKWNQDFLKTLSSLVFKYITQVVCSGSMSRKTKLTGVILKKINNITQEHVQLNSPGNFFQGVQIFIAHMLSPWLKKPNICQDLADDSLLRVKSNNINTFRFRKNRIIRKNERSSSKKAVVFKRYKFAKNKKTYNRNDRGAVGIRSMRSENEKEVGEVVYSITDYEKTTATEASRKSKNNSVKGGMRPFSKRRKDRSSIEKRSRRGEKSKTPAGSKNRADGGKNAGHKFAKNKKTYQRNGRGAVGRRSVQDENKKKQVGEIVNSVTDYEKTTTTAASRKSKNNSVKVGVRPFSKTRNGRSAIEKRSRRGEKLKTPAGSKIRAGSGKNAELDNEAESASNEIAGNEQGVETAGTSNPSEPGPLQRGRVVVAEDDQSWIQPENIEFAPEDDLPASDLARTPGSAREPSDHETVRSDPPVNGVENPRSFADSRGNVLAGSKTADDRGTSLEPPNRSGAERTAAVSAAVPSSRNVDAEEATQPLGEVSSDGGGRVASLQWDDRRNNGVETEEDLEGDRVMDELDVLSERMFARCSEDVECSAESTEGRANEPKGICHQKFELKAQRSMVIKPVNKAVAKSKNCDLSPGVIYHICKKDGDNYSVNKTILPIISENSDLNLTAGSYSLMKEAKLIVRTIQEVDSWKFDFDKCVCRNKQTNTTCFDEKLYQTCPIDNKSTFGKKNK